MVRWPRSSVRWDGAVSPEACPYHGLNGHINLASQPNLTSTSCHTHDLSALAPGGLSSRCTIDFRRFCSDLAPDERDARYRARSGVGNPPRRHFWRLLRENAASCAVGLLPRCAGLLKAAKEKQPRKKFGFVLGFPARRKAALVWVVQVSLCSGRATRIALMPLASALSARLSAMPALPKITTPPNGLGVSSI